MIPAGSGTGCGEKAMSSKPVIPKLGLALLSVKVTVLPALELMSPA